LLLDPNFRGEMQVELKKLHQETGVTFVMVTHDFSEVLSLASRAAVMNQGRIEQVGEVEEIFQRPHSPFVADFVGMKNVFSVKFSGTRALLEDLELKLGRAMENPHGYLAIRPEDIVLSKEKLSSSMQNKTVFKSLITKSALFELMLEEGAPVYFSFKSAAVHTF